MVTACTYNITMVHSEGVASDLVDQTEKTDVDAKATIPITP